MYSDSARSIVTVVELKAAWYAAAEIAKRKGYPCAAKLVKNSVLGRDYEEHSGMFSKKIKATSDFKKWIKGNDSSFRFRSGDLFYALNKVKAKITAASSQGVKIHIQDVFDFAFDDDYEDIFTSSVNNWAWLCQHTSVLNEINVDIYFYY